MPTSHAAEEVAPIPADLVESLRDFGYTLPTAIADLVDNCVTADAKRVEVIIEGGGERPFIAVVDNGRGMDLRTMVDAMRMGNKGPLTTRSTNDLGRFGLGMKTASLSQGRCFTVITKVSGAGVLVRRWDNKHIEESKKWQLLDSPAICAQHFVERIKGQPSGTAVVIEELDRAGFLTADKDRQREQLSQALDQVRRHLSMVFHRIIESGTTLRLGASDLPSWDPFLSSKSTRLPAETLSVPGHKEHIQVTPFVLPHHSHLTEEEHSAAAGPNGWNAHQGFYVYRCHRLIVPGTWLNLRLTKEEHFKLARIRIDLPNSMDALWHLNVMKSHVAAPSLLHEELSRIAKHTRAQASEVYRFRGERQAPIEAPVQRFVWRRVEKKGGVRYQVDRTHPLIYSLLHGGFEHEKLLKELIGLIEDNLPVASILQEPAKSIDGGTVASVDDDQLGKFVDMIRHVERFYIQAGKSPDAARELVMQAEPFARHRAELTKLLNINPNRRESPGGKHV